MKCSMVAVLMKKNPWLVYRLFNDVLSVLMQAVDEKEIVFHD